MALFIRVYLWYHGYRILVCNINLSSNWLYHARFCVILPVGRQNCRYFYWKPTKVIALCEYVQLGEVSVISLVPYIKIKFASGFHKLHKLFCTCWWRLRHGDVALQIHAALYMAVLAVCCYLWLRCNPVTHTKDYPDSKVNGVYMGPTWVLSALDGPHLGPVNFAIRVISLARQKNIQSLHYRWNNIEWYR